MEDMYNLTKCPWVSDEPINLRAYFDQYHKLREEVQGHPLEEVDVEDGIRSKFPAAPEGQQEDPFSVETLEAACSVEQLSVEGELQPQHAPHFSVKHNNRWDNWYSGSFKDTILPAGAADRLATLAAQAKEHHLRETVADYARLRHRQLKYFSTLRVIINENNNPEPRVSNNNTTTRDMKDIIINVQVHRPFHKKTYQKKACNRFPTYSQELLLLGSQKLTDLRDNITCTNDLAINQDLSAAPHFYQLSHIPNASSEFPSGFFYINGVFYNDMRHPEAKDYSEVIRKWAEKKSEIGPLVTKKMEETTLLDLELRLGYPYVFLHQGSCEHILVFSDVRLLHQHDIQDPSRYPLDRGQTCKLAAKCNICSMHLANWITMGDPRLPLPISLLCDRCLKTFCYDAHGKKIHTLKVYPFSDEFMQKQKMFVPQTRNRPQQQTDL